MIKFWTPESGFKGGVIFGCINGLIILLISYINEEVAILCFILYLIYNLYNALTSILKHSK